MDNHQAKTILEKYAKGECSAEEAAWVENWYLQFQDSTEELTEAEIEEARGIVRENLPVPNRFIPVMWPRIAAAASIVLVLFVGMYYFLHTPRAGQATASLVARDIPPGKNKAVLTLANGSKIDLEKLAPGTVASQGDVAIVKNSSGSLVYKDNSGTSSAKETLYNTITTPRGGQWPAIVLPDGTKAVLDASSSISYPVAFNGPERRVVITGQVYFDVAHRVNQPFKVTANSLSLEDLGTRFNVNAFADEPVIKTTLIEGKVRVSKGVASVILAPGQQATVNPAASNIQVTNADLDAEIAWINGQTIFKNRSLKQIMREVSRWYDVDVEFEGHVPERKFDGGIPRYANLSTILQVLELNDVHVRLVGKKIIIKP